MFSTRRFCDYYSPRGCVMFWLWKVAWFFLFRSSVKIGLQQCRIKWHISLHFLHMLLHILLCFNNKLQKSTSTTIPRFAVKSLGKPRMGIVENSSWIIYVKLDDAKSCPYARFECLYVCFPVIVYPIEPEFFKLLRSTRLNSQELIQRSLCGLAGR